MRRNRRKRGEKRKRVIERRERKLGRKKEINGKVGNRRASREEGNEVTKKGYLMRGSC